LLLAANRKATVAGTMRELAKNARLAPGLSGFKPHRGVNSLTANITITNDYKEGNPVTTTGVHRTVM